MRIILLFLGTILNSILFGQLPKTDVYLAEFKDLASRPTLLSLKYLSGYNPNGYNNQAKFINDDEILLTVAMDTHQMTDIFHLDLKSNSYFQFTKTEGISEFSPMQSPAKDRITVVRIEIDGIDQSLWSYPKDRSNTGYRLFPQLKNVGYYAWITDDDIAMFLVGNPHSLAIGHIISGKVEVILDNIGRCLKTDLDGNLLFVHKVRPEFWVLKSYDLSEKTMTHIVQMPDGREDFEVLSDGTFIVADGSMIKTFNPKRDKNWMTIADFATFGLNNIQRPAVSKNTVAFINIK